MKTANDPRHIQRVKMMQELFAWNFGKSRGSTRNITQNSAEILSIEAQNGEERIKSVLENIEKIDQLIREAAPERELDQINPIDLAVLRLAVFELVIELETPTEVVVDEAVEIGKEFGSDSSASFINGALGKIIKEQKIV